MATTIRQLIITAFKTMMENITTANGYETEIGSSVFEWREYPVETTEMPAMIIRDTDEEISYPDHPESLDCRLTIELILFESGSTVGADLRKAIGDIIKAIGVDETFGGYIYFIESMASSMVQEHQENIIGDVIFTIVVRYRIGRFDPYTLNQA